MPAATANAAGATSSSSSSAASSSAAAAAAATTSSSGTAAAAAAAPATPVKVPSAAASYTPATLDPDLRSQINMVLIRDGHVGKIQDHILHVLHADPANWPAAVQAHALQLLRSGEYTTFPALLERVLDDIRHDSAAARTGGAAAAKDSSKAKDGRDKSATTAGRPPLALPQAVVDEALRVTRESLDLVCEIEE